jgi:hypothetical protein
MALQKYITKELSLSISITADTWTRLDNQTILGNFPGSGTGTLYALIKVIKYLTGYKVKEIFIQLDGVADPADWIEFARFQNPSEGENTWGQNLAHMNLNEGGMIVSEDAINPVSDAELWARASTTGTYKIKLTLDMDIPYDKTF